MSVRRTTSTRQLAFLAITAAYVGFWLYVLWPGIGAAIAGGPFLPGNVDVLVTAAIPIGIGLAVAVLLPMRPGRPRGVAYQLVVVGLAALIAGLLLVLAPPAFAPGCCPT